MLWCGAGLSQDLARDAQDLQYSQDSSGMFVDEAAPERQAAIAALPAVRGLLQREQEAHIARHMATEAVRGKLHAVGRQLASVEVGKAAAFLMYGCNTTPLSCPLRGWDEGA